MAFKRTVLRSPSISHFPPGLPSEPAFGVGVAERAPAAVPLGRGAGVPHVRGVPGAEGDGRPDAGDIRQADQGAAAEGMYGTGNLLDNLKRLK